MRIQIFSDLHCDVRKHKPIAVGRDVDAVGAAGDTAEGAGSSSIRTVTAPITPASTRRWWWRSAHDPAFEELDFLRAKAATARAGDAAAIGQPAKAGAVSTDHQHHESTMLTTDFPFLLPSHIEAAMPKAAGHAGT
jgi:hypothetical protein